MHALLNFADVQKTGAIADNSKSRFGRRRPYMLLGTVICSVSMLLLGFTRDVVSIIIPRGTSLVSPVFSLFCYNDRSCPQNDTVTIILAVVALYGIDFSVNAVQAVDRALIVDSIPFSEQPDGNAWAARMLGLGSVVGFFMCDSTGSHSNLFYLTFILQGKSGPVGTYLRSWPNTAGSTVGAICTTADVFANGNCSDCQRKNPHLFIVSTIASCRRYAQSNGHVEGGLEQDFVKKYARYGITF